MSSNMVRRVLFAVIAIPLVVAIVWAGGWFLAALLMLAAVLGSLEVFDLAERGGVAPLRWFGAAAALVVPLALQLLLVMPSIGPWFGNGGAYLALALFLLAFGVVAFVRGAGQRPLEAIAVTLFAVFYAAALPSTAFLIRHARWSTQSWTGASLVFFPLVVTWVCDTAAMFGGRIIGGAKLAPTLSPNKTWAGSISGSVAGTAAGIIFAAAVFPRTDLALGILPAGVLALALSVVGQVGDLAESSLKREAGVKDSSSLIPGHGGILDRLDSLYFVLPAAAIGYHLAGIL